MKTNQITILDNYLKSGIKTILLENININVFEERVELEANCDISLLNGHYENVDFVPPKWYEELTEKSKSALPILVIKDIDKVSQDEQTKFLEILKYRKVSTFYLPENTIIILSCSNPKQFPIAEEIYSLVAHI